MIFGIKVLVRFLSEGESDAIEFLLSIGNADEYNDVILVVVIFGISKENPSQHEKITTKKIRCSIEEISMIRIVVPDSSIPIRDMNIK